MTLLAVGLSLAAALAVYRRSGVMTRLLPLAALGLTGGALLATNAWDFPPYVALGPAAIAIAYVSRGTRLIPAVVYGSLTLGVLVVIGFVSFAPYHASNIAFYTDVVRSPEKTPIHSYIAIFGLPLFILSSALIVSLWRAAFSSRQTTNAIVPYPVRTWTKVFRWNRRALSAVAIGVGATMLAVPVWASGFEVAAVNGVLLVAIATTILIPGTQLPTRLAFAAAGLALLLIIGVDLYAIDDRLVRMNTIFRVYIQAWVLLGLASGFLMWRLAQDGAFRRMLRSPVKLGFAAGLGLLVFAAGVYPVLGTRARLADRFETLPRTLDGLAYAQSATYRDIGDAVVALAPEVEGIEWLRRNVSGSPVVAEAVVPPAPNDVTYFRYLSRVAVLTGLPVVVGWPWHQTQQRGIGRAEPFVNARLADVRRLYSVGEADVVRAIIEKYDIEYLMVGQLERLYYPSEGLAIFDEMPELERNEINDQVAIYRVRESQVAVG
jgi:YYY domain-containing protein